MNHDAESRSPRDWATIPNAITLLRLALVIPVALLIVEGSRPVFSVVLLILFGGSDWVDGYLARKLGQTSTTGELLDPIADRVGVAVIVLALVAADHLSVWLVVAITGVDLALAAAYLVMRPSQAPTVTWIGKVRTAVLMTGILLVGLGAVPGLQPFDVAGQALCVVGAGLHLIAGVGYFSSILGSPHRP